MISLQKLIFIGLLAGSASMILPAGSSNSSSSSSCATAATPVTPTQSTLMAILTAIPNTLCELIEEYAATPNAHNVALDHGIQKDLPGDDFYKNISAHFYSIHTLQPLYIYAPRTSLDKTPIASTKAPEGVNDYHPNGFRVITAMHDDSALFQRNTDYFYDPINKTIYRVFTKKALQTRIDDNLDESKEPTFLDLTLPQDDGCTLSVWKSKDDPCVIEWIVTTPKKSSGAVS